jgi:hypothetical protein
LQKAALGVFWEWHTPCVKPDVRFLLSFALLLNLVQGRAEAGSVAVAEFPFQFREGLIWIQVSVPQSATPLNFMLDSGAGVSVINLPAAKSLRLNSGHKVLVRGVHATSVGYWPQPLEARAGSVPLPEDYLMVDLGELSQACACPVDGLLGADFFRQHIVQIDFVAQKIRLLDSLNPGKAAESLPLELRPCGMRVPIQVNGGKERWVRLDTGCASALQWVTSQVASESCLRQPAIGMTTVSVPMTETTVHLGKTEFKSVPTGLHDTEIFAGEAGLLGNGLLSRFSSITIDPMAGRLILEKRP